mmetsp:Transcript_80742/g.234180  ORF Transcript_80742/g.234180 Transcript_80742/m.234180 type:complete len:245 (-) Transcript_80742:278-1012(-)
MDLFPGPWRLAWVHERIFRDERRLQHVSSCVKSRGGLLVCKKKAMQLGCWAAEQGELLLPFILVTDWREAQPSTALLAEHAAAHERLLLMLVVCDSPAQARRASAWVSKSEMGELFVGRMHVVTAGEIPISLLGGLIHDCFQAGRTAIDEAPAHKVAKGDLPPEALQPQRISLADLASCPNASGLFAVGRPGGRALEAPLYVNFNKLLGALGNDAQRLSPCAESYSTGASTSPSILAKSDSEDL